MRRQLACVVLLLAFTGCNDDDEHPVDSSVPDAAMTVSDAGTTPDAALVSTADASTRDAAPAPVTSCLDMPSSLPMPSSVLNCDLLPPDFAR